MNDMIKNRDALDGSISANINGDTGNGISREQTNSGGLVDIREVVVDKNLTKEERIAEFVRQIKDPYHFKCGKFTVTARFTDGGPTLEDCLGRLMT